MSDQGVRPSSSRSGQLVQFRSAHQDLTTYGLQLRNVITSLFELRFWVFLYSIESPLSQESIDLPEDDIRCQTEVLDRARPG